MNEFKVRDRIYMKNFISQLVKLFILVFLIITLPLNAQDKEQKNQFKIDFFKVFDSSSGKIINLADAIPSEDYDWRPTENVRSIKESLMHLAGTHYYLASKLNNPVPEGIEPGDFEESVNTKEEAREILLKSIEHIRLAIENVNDNQLYESVNFFGGKETRQRVILQVGEHMAEHLGQLVVYARMKNVTPPWSR
jgi:uncharacterized damage-inducible protein DinB